MSRKLLTFLAFAFMLSIGSVYAQGKTVTGTVTDNNGSPLPGVTIAVKGQPRGTNSDFDGNFTIENVTAADVLVFTSIGYQRQEVTVGNQTTINVTMAESTENLDEVVVTALGIKKEKRAVGVSVQSVKGEEVAERQEYNVVDALKGRVAGVRIQNSDAGVGGSTRIVIRGGNNLDASRSDQPLIVVDGVQIENDINRISGSGRDWGSGINSINPDDIEDMQVLKGANAAALYGARGANGVILITTKKGRASNGVGVEYTYSLRIEDIYKTRDVQNIYGIGYNGWNKDEPFPTNSEGNLVPPGVSFWGSGASWGPKMDGTMVQWYDGEMRPFTPQPDNLTAPFQTGYTNVHTVAIQGANEKGNFRVSLTDTKAEGIQPNAPLERLNLSLNAGVNLTDKLNAQVVFNYSEEDHTNPRLSGDNDNSFGKALLYNWARSEKVQLRLDNYKNPDGTRNNDWDFGRGGNLLWDILEMKENRVTERYRGAFTVNWQIKDWLSLMMRSGIDNMVRRYSVKLPARDLNGLEGGYRSGLSKEDRRNHQFIFSANKEINEDLSLTANFGGERVSDDRYSLNSAWYWGFSNPGIYAIRNARGDARNPSEGFYAKRVNSLFASVDLAYKNYLFLQLTGRNDWSSTLPANANSYFYPGVNTSFVFTDATDIKESLPWLSFGKLRASWALASTDDAPFSLQPTYDTGNWYGSSWASLPGTIPPANLKPQQVYSYEAGFDLGLFNEKLNLNFTYYGTKSTDQIVRGDVSRTTGFNNKKSSTGSMTNKGIEVSINAFPVVTDDFKWEVMVNFAKNKNKVVELDEEGGVTQLALDGIWGNNGPSIVAKKGLPYGTIMGWDFIYDDATGKPLVNSDGYPYRTNHRVALGNITPDFTGGMFNTFTYKNFMLTAVLDAKVGGDMWFGSKAVGDSFGQSPASLWGRDTEYGGLSWTDSNGNARTDGTIMDAIVSDQPVYNEGTDTHTYNTSGENTSIIPARHYWVVRSSGWGAGAPTQNAIYENSWLQLTELQLSYNLPKSIIEKAGLQNLSLSVFGRNLAYLWKTAPDNINPRGNMNPSKTAGIEFGASPMVRQFGLRVRAAF